LRHLLLGRVLELFFRLAALLCRDQLFLLAIQVCGGSLGTLLRQVGGRGALFRVSVSLVGSFYAAEYQNASH